ncbi:MAG: hypothetical protein N5P05_001257 [Chroococcopsis gigantea SAG 12.99]|nr:hypothetical protein [Chlorogloea purpurea SAG 13.99]MDV2999651.1 hypothetical protein [Chroococcopsis gigantea SAG 12.99]
MSSNTQSNILSPVQGITFDPNGINLSILSTNLENLPPIAVDDSASTFEDQILYGNVLTNDSDPNGDPITISAINGNPNAVGNPIFLPSGAILLMEADGTYFYDPNGRFDNLNDGNTADDNLEYTITDPSSNQSNINTMLTGDNKGNVFIRINGKNPLQDNSTTTAVDDTGITPSNQAFTGNVLANDSNSEGRKLVVSALNGTPFQGDANITMPSGAKLQLSAAGYYFYDPRGQFNNLQGGQTATEKFTYTARTYSLGSKTADATVTITIEGVNALPPGFDPAEYGASNPNLIPIYRNDLAGLTNHYLQYGRNENRPINTFDPLRYIASSYTPDHNGDLINAFVLNGAAATQHYLTNGYFEGRSTSAFIPSRYLDSYPDLLTAPSIGTNIVAATQHFISYGFAEKRNPDLFAADRYIASHPDLIQAYHYDIQAGSDHYLFHGRDEGRKITFDPFAYMAKYPDVAAAYNNDPLKATFHYITDGFAHGRSPG